MQPVHTISVKFKGDILLHSTELGILMKKYGHDRITLNLESNNLGD